MEDTEVDGGEVSTSRLQQTSGSQDICSAALENGWWCQFCWDLFSSKPVNHSDSWAPPWRVTEDAL